MRDKFGGRPSKDDLRPILICIVGLGGGNNNCYASSLMIPASKMGYKVCVLIFRGASDLKLLTPKFYNGYSWEDL
jgi:predicted alpha/beta-fold hydrolase